MDSQNSNMYAWKRKSFLFAPLIFLAHLFFFTRCKIIFDIKCFSDFLWGFTFDHIGHCLTRYIQQSLKWNIFYISNVPIEFCVSTIFIRSAKRSLLSDICFRKRSENRSIFWFNLENDSWSILFRCDLVNFVSNIGGWWVNKT